MFRPKRGGLPFCVCLVLVESLACVSALSASLRWRLRTSESTEGSRRLGGASGAGESVSQVRSMTSERRGGVCELEAEEGGSTYVDMIGVL